MKKCLILYIIINSLACSLFTNDKAKIKHDLFLNEDKRLYPIFISETTEGYLYKLILNDSITYYRSIENEKKVIHWYTVNNHIEGQKNIYESGLLRRVATYKKDSIIALRQYYYNGNRRLDSITISRCDNMINNNTCNSYLVGRHVFNSENLDSNGTNFFYDFNNTLFPVIREGAFPSFKFNIIAKKSLCMFSKCSPQDLNMNYVKCAGNTLENSRLVVSASNPVKSGIYVILDGYFYFCNNSSNNSAHKCFNYIPVYYPILVMDSLMYDELF